MKVKIFSSGSKANVTLIEGENENILIDLGLSRLQIIKNLKDVNLTLNDIDAILITHEHSDHTLSFNMFLKENIKMYMTKGTFKGIYESLKKQKRDNSLLLSLMEEKYKDGSIVIFEHDNDGFYYLDFNINMMNITPIPCFHDAKEPCGFIMKENDKKYVHITDTGYVHQNLFDSISNADAYLLESNHDTEILMHSERPYELKMRISSEHGHLSNVNSMVTLAKIIGPKTHLVMHAHVSEECNLSNIITLTREKVFNEYGIACDGIDFVILAARPTGEFNI